MSIIYEADGGNRAARDMRYQTAAAGEGTTVGSSRRHLDTEYIRQTPMGRENGINGMA
jgi:hypothetical protein